MKAWVASPIAKQLLLLLLVATTSVALAADRYFRYINENGVTVMDSRIPPEYVKNGYEVVTLSGRVLQVVPPAPSAEELEELAAQRAHEAELAEMDRYLLRRYSRVGEIEAAKQRKLADFEASMSILRGNAATIENQIETVQSRAANVERSGREVPQSVLENLRELQGELAKVHQQMEQRELERAMVEERFDREIERFVVIKPAS